MWLEVPVTTERLAHMHTCTGPHLHPFKHRSVGPAFPAAYCRQAAGCWRSACCWVRCHKGSLHLTSPTHRTQPRSQSMPPHLSSRIAVGCILCHSLLQECPCLSQVWAGSCVWSCQAPVDATCFALLRIARTKWTKDLGRK